MSLPRTIRFLPYAAMLFGAACVVSVSASQIDVLLSVDNRAGGKEGVVYGRALDDLGFLRKATVDMVGVFRLTRTFSSSNNGPRPSGGACLLIG